MTNTFQCDNMFTTHIKLILSTVETRHLFWAPVIMRWPPQDWGQSLLVVAVVSVTFTLERICCEAAISSCTGCEEAHWYILGHGVHHWGRRWDQYRQHMLKILHCILVQMEATITCCILWHHWIGSGHVFW